jgi:hypothetical protein
MSVDFVLLHVTLYSLARCYRCFGGTYLLDPRGLKRVTQTAAVLINVTACSIQIKTVN